MEYGYVRVSTKEQNEQRQTIVMREFWIDEKRIYMDKQSGKDFEQTKYKKLLWKIKSVDTLVVKSIDRLGRNYKEQRIRFDQRLIVNRKSTIFIKTSWEEKQNSVKTASVLSVSHNDF